MHITQIGVEHMGDLANSLKDPDVLRLENLDTDLRPPQSAVEYTKRAVDDDKANSYLPFFGLDVLRQAAASLVGRQSAQHYDWKTECIISAGGLSGILNVLLATLEPGDNAGMQACVETWQRRRDVLLEELRDFVAIPPHGGWSLLLDVTPLGLDGVTASKRLLALGKIAATPMLHWGSAHSRQYVRFVFANEPVHRLREVGKRVKQALT
jgi:aspartate/methionine/tyrosine aminotransferase